VLYAALYVLGAFICGSVSHQSADALKRDWVIVAVFALPVILLAFRMLWALLTAVWFAVVILASIVVVCAAASVALPTEAALAKVYRTFPFAALGATLAASLFACVLNRPFSSGRLAFIALHCGLAIGIAGAFTSLFHRVSATVALAEGETATRATLRDFRLVVRGEGDEKAEIVLPVEGARAGAAETVKAQFGSLRLSLIYEKHDHGGLLRVLADGEAGADAVNVVYGGMPQVLSIGETSYMVSFGPSHVELPFRLRLEKATVEYYPASRLPRRFAVDVEIASPDGENVRTETIEINRPAEAGGFDVLLTRIGFGGTAVFEVSRDPGAPILFAGGIIATAGFTAAGLKKARAHRESG
jgi:hypothetical protein